MSINVSNLSIAKVIEFLEKCFSNVTNFTPHSVMPEADMVEAGIYCEFEPISIDFKEITMDFNEAAMELPEIKIAIAS